MRGFRHDGRSVLGGHQSAGEGGGPECPGPAQVNTTTGSTLTGDRLGLGPQLGAVGSSRVQFAQADLTLQRGVATRIRNSGGDGDVSAIGRTAVVKLDDSL